MYVWVVDPFVWTIWTEQEEKPHPRLSDCFVSWSCFISFDFSFFLFPLLVLLFVVVMITRLFKSCVTNSFRFTLLLLLYFNNQSLLIFLSKKNKKKYSLIHSFIHWFMSCRVNILHQNLKKKHEINKTDSLTRLEVNENPRTRWSCFVSQTGTCELMLIKQVKESQREMYFFAFEINPSTDFIMDCIFMSWSQDLCYFSCFFLLLKELKTCPQI